MSQWHTEWHTSYILWIVKCSVTLVFTGFIDALRITAVVALSKKTFKSLYPTEASKVHVLLSLWGVGDPLKLEQLRSAHQQKAFWKYKKYFLKYSVCYLCIIILDTKYIIYIFYGF